MDNVTEYLHELIKFRNTEYAEISEFNNFSEDDAKAYIAKTESIEKCMNDISSLNDKYVRLAADFDNYKKRTEREKLDIIKQSNKIVLDSFLNIVDDMERMLNVSNDDGFKLIYDNMLKLLKENGCTKIECNVGDAFNVDFHEAISLSHDDNVDSGCISKIFKSGWMLNGKVLRPVMAIVAR